MDDLYSNLPDDPELAFVCLVEAFQADLDANVQHSDANADTSTFILDFMNSVIAAAVALGIEEFSKDGIPDRRRGTLNDYDLFSRRVKRHVLGIKIRNGRSAKTFSVALDTTAKKKLRHYISQIKGLLENEDFDERKKDALRAKLADFEEEVERERTRFDRVMAATLAVVDVFGKGAAKLDHLTELLNAIARVMAEAKSAEPMQDRLPPPPPRKQIPPPTPRQDTGSDIPF